MNQTPSTPTDDNARRAPIATVTDVWCPGNSTRYELFLTRPETGPILFAWLNPGRGPGRTCELFEGNEYDGTYLMEKLGLTSMADAAALLAWLRRAGFSVYLPPDYNEHGCYRYATG